MAISVLIVDDSGFFRRRIREILGADPRLQVIGEAKNGQEAIEMAQRLRPDIITMDIEMPVMDGIVATRRIMATAPCPILMFSSLTTDGARITLDALDAGAVDYLPKRFEDISRNREEASRALCDRVAGIAAGGRVRLSTQPVARSVTAPVRPGVVSRPAHPVAPPAAPQTSPLSHHPRPAPATTPAASLPRRSGLRLVAIGTSTGGPVALQEVLTRLPANFPLPILLVQHMPATFTPAFAQRLDQLCQISVREAVDGDELRPALALLAPGGRQMQLEQRANRLIVRIGDTPADLTYRPSVDVTFFSIARTLPGAALAIVLTGMGADGREGAREMKRGGSTIWSQDEASCVVFGMPAAIQEAGLSDQVLSLAEVGPALARL
jgi:two-component system, chemotaxis family, protein-glutamate methylesterase/glutaminase